MNKNRHELDTQMCLCTQRWTHTHTHASAHIQTHSQIYIYMHTHLCTHAHAHRTPYQHSDLVLCPLLYTPPQAGEELFQVTVTTPPLSGQWNSNSAASLVIVICSRISAHRGAGSGWRSGPLTFSQEVPLSAPPPPPPPPVPYSSVAPAPDQYNLLS